jgi:hypothetical protein
MTPTGTKLLQGLWPLAAMFGLCAVLVAPTALAAPVATPVPDCDRVYGIGDIHGAYDALVSILQKTGLVDAEANWSGGENCLVQTGDIVDRGPRSREVLDLLIKLEAQAKGRLIVLLGNHEVMNLTGDLRYVAREEFGAYATDEGEAEREAWFKSFAETAAVAELPEGAQRAAFDRDHPPGYFGHRRAFSPAGRYWRWLSGKPIVTRVGGSLFVHGGLSLADAEGGIESLNSQASGDLRRYVDLRRGLEQGGLIHPLQSFGDTARAVRAWVEENAPSGGDTPAHIGTDLRRNIYKMFDLLQSPIFRSDGPLWNRDFANQSEGYVPTVEKILEAVGAKRVLVGHSVTQDHVVRARFGDRVFLMDTGAGPAYEGQVSTLEVSRNGRVRAVYADREVVLGRPDIDWLEQALADGEILESKPLGIGVTKPQKLLIEWEGRRIEAVFKAVNVEESGVTVMANATAEINFTDSYRWELGAYLLDRQLGLNMVPVTVERRIDGQKGVVIEWIEDTISETERIERQIDIPADSGRIEKLSTMLLFDALIYNVDRNPGNWLWTHDWQLYLIDHSRSFRLNKKLPKNVAETTLQVPRWLYDRLGELELETLVPALSTAVDRGRVKMVMKRRDALIAKIERQRKDFGDDVVFTD